MNHDIFRGTGVEIKLAEREQFLKVKETLTRIGTVEDGTNNLYQECHILHKRGRYVIAHYRELQKLDGLPVYPTEEDLAIRNTIANMLEAWGLVELVASAPLSNDGEKPTVIRYDDKPNWNLIEQYAIGKPKDYLMNKQMRVFNE